MRLVGKLNKTKSQRINLNKTRVANPKIQAKYD